VAAYDLALSAGEEPLAQALCKNILNGEAIEHARQLAAYAESVIAALDGLDETALRGASWKFPLPAQADAQP
jgi:cytochrome b pre-mRNA-processing protein 3